jgi:hypothetical protein
MSAIQIALADRVYGEKLRDLLIGGGARYVKEVDTPDLNRGGIVVTDCEHMRLLPIPIPDPKRVVLIAVVDGASIAKAWEAGVRSVIPTAAPPSTAAMAVWAAALRGAKKEVQHREYLR